tara:strand:+ start:668 stop:1615 length:948 start_codon:yes stop_codon:yes gene_type:complete
MSGQITVSFIGAGYMAREHIRAFQSIPSIQLKGIHSRTRKKAVKLASQFGIVHVCDSITELYEKTKADLVIIAVPVLNTKDVCFDAFHYPWMLLVEKPVGYDVIEAEEIMALAKKLRKLVFVGLNRRYYKSTKKAVQDIASSDELRLICVYDQEDPRATWEEARSEKLIENWMYANSIHLIDYFRMFGRGEIQSVKPIIRWDPVRPRFVISQLQYSSGDVGLYQAVWGGPGPWAVTVTTQRSRWELRPLERAIHQSYGSGAAVEVSTDEIDKEDLKTGLRKQAQDLVKAVKGQDNCLVTLDDALETMRLVKRIYD